jgi:hypothetical protein
MNSATAIHKYLSALGKKGGAAGTGAKKRRGSPEYYRAISAKGAAARAANRKARLDLWPAPAVAISPDGGKATTAV